MSEGNVIIGDNSSDVYEKMLAVPFNVVRLGMYGSNHATYTRYSVMVRAMRVCSSHVHSVMRRRMSHAG